MHFFIQSKKRSNQSSRQKLHLQEQQPQKRIIKKIVVKKKPKQKQQDLKDQIIQVQSQNHVVQSISKSRSGSTFNNNQLGVFHKMNPYGSFMAPQIQYQQNIENGMQTPALHLSSPNYNLQSFTNNIQTQSIQRGSEQRQKNLTRTKSKPIQPITYQQSRVNLRKRLRKNSMQTDIQNMSRRLHSYPTQLPSQGESSQYHQADNQQFDDNYNEQMQIGNGIPITYFPPEYLNQKKQQQPSSYTDRRQKRLNTYNNNEKQIHTVDNIPLNIQDYASSSYNKVNKTQQLNPLNSQRSNNSRNQLGVIVSQRSSQHNNQNKQQTHNQQPQRYTGKYHSYIQKQNKQLLQQRQRMMHLSQQANRVIANDQQIDNHHHSDSNVDKHFVALKYILQQLVQLFIVAQVIKYQLRYRSYQVLTKIFTQASNYYQQKIKFQQPIKAYTFSIALKAVLSEYQKSQLDIIINKIFHANHELTYEEFFKQFESILNSKQVSLFQPESMKRQVDKTFEKIKRLFVIWIEIEYFNKKIKQILRNNKVVYDSILLQCSSQEQPDRLDIELIQKFLLQTSKKSHLKKLKIDIFFRNLIGGDLLKKRWSDWIHTDQMRFYNRFESKFAYQKKQYTSSGKSSLNNKSSTYNKSSQLINKQTLGRKSALKNINQSHADKLNQLNKKSKQLVYSRNLDQYNNRKVDSQIPKQSSYNNFNNRNFDSQQAGSFNVAKQDSQVFGDRKDYKININAYRNN